MKHAMIDIETLGVTADAVVTQIGAVIIDNANPELDKGKMFIQGILLEDSLNYGSIDASTLQFWSKQDPALYKSMLNGTMPLYEVLDDLKGYLLENQVDYCWANGILFDFGILEDKYNKLNVEPHWPFYSLMDYRTIRNTATSLGWNEADMPNNQQAHNALADAIYQANCLIDMHRKGFINLNNIGGRNNV